MQPSASADTQSSGGRTMWRPDAVFTLVLTTAYAIASAVVLIAMLRKRLRREKGFERFQVVDFCMLNISAADFCHGILYTIVFSLANGDYHSNYDACRANYAVSAVLGVASVWFTSFLAFSRYALVREPIGKGLSWRATFLGTIVIWGCSTTYGGVLLTQRAQAAPSGVYCGLTQSAGTENGFVVTFLLGAPCIIIFYCYRKVTLAVKRTIASDDNLVRRIATMCLVLNIVFMLAYAPFIGLSVYYISTGQDYYARPGDWDGLVFIANLLNFVANPIAFVVFSFRVRWAVFDLLHISTSQIDQSRGRTTKATLTSITDGTKQIGASRVELGSKGKSSVPTSDVETAERLSDLLHEFDQPGDYVESTEPVIVKGSSGSIDGGKY